MFRLKIGVMLAALLVFSVFHEPILAACGDLLVVSSTPQQSDLIVVLAGDFFGSRVLKGAELGSRGYAKHVLISGAPYRDTYECDLAVRFAVEKGYDPRLFLTAGHHAKSTIEEALALGAELRRLGAKHVTLVTSDYHSRRALLVFRLFLPDFQFHGVAAPTEHFQARSWWKQSESRALVFSEWSKIVGTVLIKAGSYVLY